MRQILAFFVAVATCIVLAFAKPVLEGSASTEESSGSAEVDPSNATNETIKELYVVRAVIYEIGILTEVNETDLGDSSEEIQQHVQLTFSANNRNGSLDFGDIPLPIQTNVSGQVLTGIAPVHVGEVADLTSALGALPITGTIVNITQSDGGVFKLETLNATSPLSLFNSTDDLSSLTLPSSIPLLQNNNLVPA